MQNKEKLINMLPVSDKVGKEVMKKSKEVGHKSGFGIGIKLRKVAEDLHHVNIQFQYMTGNVMEELNI